MNTSLSSLKLFPNSRSFSPCTLFSYSLLFFLHLLSALSRQLYYYITTPFLCQHFFPVSIFFIVCFLYIMYFMSVLYICYHILSLLPIIISSASHCDLIIYDSIFINASFTRSSSMLSMIFYTYFSPQNILCHKFSQKSMEQFVA